jgi:hypothetical protein
MRARAAGLTSVVLLTAAGAVADAARSPTFGERVAITRALPAELRRYPVGCVRLVTVVSRSGLYARVTPEYLVRPSAGAQDACLRYAANGYFVLRKRPNWRVQGSLSDRPPCAWGVPRDLAPSCAR